jgi:hypothetical protein
MEPTVSLPRQTVSSADLHLELQSWTVQTKSRSLTEGILRKGSTTLHFTLAILRPFTQTTPKRGERAGMQDIVGSFEAIVI